MRPGSAAAGVAAAKTLPAPESLGFKTADAVEAAGYELYMARCRDTGEPPTREEGVRFRALVVQNFTESSVKLRNARLGVQGASAIARVIRSKATLERLDLYQNNLRDTGIAYLCQFLSVPSTPCATRLSKLNFGCNDAGDDAGQAVAQFLAQTQTVTSLELGSQADHRGANRITRRGLDFIARALVEHPSLEHLGLNRNPLGTGESSIDGKFVLAQALQRNSALTSLALGWAGLPPADTLDLAEVLLRDNRTLATLVLSGNKLSAQVGAALGQVVKVNGALQGLFLAETGLGVRGVGPIAEALKSGMCGLTTLDLAGCGIETQGAVELAEGIAENRTLTALNISHNGIQPDGGAALARALASNPVLASLSANANSLRDQTALEFAALLAAPGCVLTHLELSSCKIGDAGAVALAAGAARGASLVVLKLKDNFVTQAGSRALLEALEGTVNLATIDLRGNQLDFGTLGGVEKVAQRNASRVKAAEPSKLKDEIVRLIREKDKIADVEEALSKERAAVQLARRRVEDCYADIETTRVESEMLVKEVEKQVAQARLAASEAREKYSSKIEEYEKVRVEYEKQFKELGQATEQEERQEEEFLRGSERIEGETQGLRQATEERVKALREGAAEARARKEELIRQAILLRDELQRLRDEAKAREAAAVAAAEAAEAAAAAKAEATAAARAAASKSVGLHSESGKRASAPKNAAVNSMLLASMKVKTDASGHASSKGARSSRSKKSVHAAAGGAGDSSKQPGKTSDGEENSDVEYDAGN